MADNKTQTQDVENVIATLADIENSLILNSDGTVSTKYHTEWQIDKFDFINGSYGPQILLNLSRLKPATKLPDGTYVPEHWTKRYAYLDIAETISKYKIKVVPDDMKKTIKNLKDFISKCTSYQVESYQDSEGKWVTVSEDLD